MKYLTLALSASIIAVILAPLAFSADEVASQIRAIDPAKRTITLTDGSVMLVDPAVDLTQVKPNDKVRVFAVADEDGFSPATEIRVVN